MDFLTETVKTYCPPMRTKPRGIDWEELATIFLSKMDDDQVFPKLPQTLKAHFDKWSCNQEMKIVGERIHNDLNFIMKEMTPSNAPAPIAIHGEDVAQSMVDREQAQISFSPAPFVPPLTATH
jgi:hypothetical protein